MKAMILAAGRGERLRPLTDRMPKALVDAGGKPLLAWHLERLRRAGVREVVINVSHLASQITERFGNGAEYGLAIRWSHEPQALETAGGIVQALALLGAEQFLLVNADIWCDYEFSGLRNHKLGSHLAHLVLVPNPPHHLKGDFSLNGDSVGGGPAPRYTYAGIAVLSPEIVTGIRPGDKVPLGPMLIAAAARGAITGELHRGVWKDIGTAERLAALQAMLEGRSNQ
ncbi:MAG TPA: nucleotidyltransferase family protein [Burkholderiales bacterium]|jgi:MurNAc alpha-1-phosphate uridylyltransferase|nr:nucleotidyltransferase family protein [Burkholderiales bacterium]